MGGASVRSGVVGAARTLVWKLQVFSGSHLGFKFVGRRGDGGLLGGRLALAAGTPRAPWVGPNAGARQRARSRGGETGRSPRFVGARKHFRCRPTNGSERAGKGARPRDARGPESGAGRDRFKDARTMPRSAPLAHGFGCSQRASSPLLTGQEGPSGGGGGGEGSWVRAHAPDPGEARSPPLGSSRTALVGGMAFPVPGGQSLKSGAGRVRVLGQKGGGVI